MPAKASAQSQSPVQDAVAVPHPGTIKINVQGAFIVNEESSPTLEVLDGIDYEQDTNDIRLPNHRTVVSHVAVDVRIASRLSAVKLMPFPRSEALLPSSSTSPTNQDQKSLVDDCTFSSSKRTRSTTVLGSCIGCSRSSKSSMAQNLLSYVSWQQVEVLSSIMRTLRKL